MSQRRFAALVLAAVATLAACGSSDSSDSGAAAATVDGDAVAVGDAPLPGGDGSGGGSLGDAMEVAAGAPGEAADAACVIDRETFETAVEAYELLNGSLPTSQQQLLDAQMIREPSERFSVSSDGTVIATHGGPCA